MLSGEVVAITGAASGIGRALADGLAESGANLALADIDGAALERAADALAARGARVFHQRTDIASPAQCADFSAGAETALGPISVLVNNAALLRSAAFGSAEFAAAWQESFAVNVTGAMNMVAACLEQLKRRRGRIVNIGSTAARFAAPGGIAYSTSKAALTQFTRALAVELGPLGIRVNAIAPGVTRTPLAEPVIADLAARYRARIPLGHFAEPADMVGPVLFLASALSGHVTGAVLPVDGGYSATGVVKD